MTAQMVTCADNGSFYRGGRFGDYKIGTKSLKLNGEFGEFFFFLEKIFCILISLKFVAV